MSIDDRLVQMLETEARVRAIADAHAELLGAGGGGFSGVLVFADQIRHLLGVR